jgi:hypothetical protein
MKYRLTVCSAHLEEVESQLLRILESADAGPEERNKAAEALSLVQQARKAISETQASLKKIDPSLDKTGTGKTDTGKKDPG